MCGYTGVQRANNQENLCKTLGGVGERELPGGAAGCGATAGGVAGGGLHSSTFQLNLSRFGLKIIH